LESVNLSPLTGALTARANRPNIGWRAMKPKGHRRNEQSGCKLIVVVRGATRMPTLLLLSNNPDNMAFWRTSPDWNRPPRLLFSFPKSAKKGAAHSNAYLFFFQFFPFTVKCSVTGGLGFLACYFCGNCMGG
jgi:hypothetical protein